MLAAVLPQRSLRSVSYWWEGAVWLDQGNTGTCVANALAHNIADGPVTHPDSDITEDWAQYLYLEATGDATLDEGTDARTVLNTLRRRGDVSSYTRAYAVPEIVTHLLDIGPMVFGGPWHEGMDNYQRLYNNAYLSPTGRIRGGHEFLLNGVNIAPRYGPPYVRMKNSWGRAWAHYGTARIPLDALESLLEEGGDCFSCVEVPGIVR